MEKVPKSKSNICPYCNYKAKADEGYSIMREDSIAIIICPVCSKSYYYLNKKFSRMDIDRLIFQHDELKADLKLLLLHS